MFHKNVKAIFSTKNCPPLIDPKNCGSNRHNGESTLHMLSARQQVDSSDIKLAGLGSFVYIHRLFDFSIDITTSDTSCVPVPAGYPIAEL